MSNLFAIAGAKFYIGPIKEPTTIDFISTDFTATSPDQYVLVDGWMTAGRFGDNSAAITTPLINRGRDVKQKGTKNAGQMQNQFAVITADPGQAALIAAAQTSSNYAFKVVFTDVTEYFVGLVMTAEEVGGAANTVRALSGTIEINSNVVEVANS